MPIAPHGIHNMNSSRLENLALSYYNSSIMDGAGSQLQRIYSIYALSRFLGVSYVHTPLQEMNYHGFAALEKNEGNPELVARYNKIFTLPSDLKIPANAKTYNLFKTDFYFLKKIRDELKNSDEFFLLNIVSPHPMVDEHPEMLQHLKAVTPFETTPSPFFKIAIHVRRGDLLVSPEGHRMLPNSYYSNIALQIIEVLRKLDISFVCELHTELPSTTFSVTPEHHGMKNRIQQSVIVRSEKNELEDFEVIPNLKKFINHDPIETLRTFATADLFIMSRSAFSYLPAMLNKKGIIVYHPFWHATPMEWIDATHQASFQERLIAACMEWKMKNLRVKSIETCESP